MANSGAYDVSIIGGGLVGTAAAWFLARQGIRTILLERGDLNARASGANAGSIHLQIPVAEYRSLGVDWATHFAPTLTMMEAGARLWGTLEEDLGATLEFRNSGGIISARTDADMDVVRTKAALEARHGIQSHILDQTELRERAPYLSHDMIGGAYYPGEGKANPLLATNAFARAAIAAGVHIQTQAEVTAISSGRNFTVQTRSGTFQSEKVICAAGADAGQIATMTGNELPIRGFPIQVSVTESVGPLVPHLVYSASGKLTLKQMANGTYIVGGGWPARLDENGSLTVSDASLVANMAIARSVVPALGALRIVRSWPAIVNGNDSWRPIVGEAPGCPGFYFCIFPWMGFTAGPVAARCVADMIVGRAPAFDATSVSELPG